jgi:hypothetical protein
MNLCCTLALYFQSVPPLLLWRFLRLLPLVLLSCACYGFLLIPSAAFYDVDFLCLVLVLIFPLRLPQF